MEKYLTFYFPECGYNIQICVGRRFTEEEKTHYAEWYRDYGFMGVPNEPKITLPDLTWEDSPKRDADGSYLGCENRAWIITEAERDYYVQLNAERSEERKKKEISERIACWKGLIEKAERQPDIPTREEVQRRIRAWNNVQNEGGDGYRPLIISREDYDFAVEQLRELGEEAQE